MIVVTGAAGQLGRLVIDKLLQIVPAQEIVAAVRDPEKVAAWAARGVQVRRADYSQPRTLDQAFAGAEKVLLISSNDQKARIVQHWEVIEAAVRCSVKLFAYTSVLHADRSLLDLAGAHRQTEALLLDSGLPFVLLRNGWYSENYTAAVPSALAHGALLGSAGAGRIASAARDDYAAAAVAVLTRPDQAGRVYELAGDAAYTLGELAAEISDQAGRRVVYNDLPKAEYKAALIESGTPEPVASLLADSDFAASKGALFDDARQLSKLIGRPTTPMRESVAKAMTA